jgi:hypothetical protein
MILTPEIEKQLVDLIEGAPNVPLLLPEHAYGKDGRAVVLVDGLPIDLHRHLHNLLIRPLDYTELMFDTSGVKGNVNPHLFHVTESRASLATHCRKGHPYEGNEAPPNTRGYRCLTCLRDSRRGPASSLPNSQKTHCPQGHEYTPENTIINADGKRRCRTCRADRRNGRRHHDLESQD